MSLWAESNGLADLLGVQVLLDNALNDGGQLGIHESVAGLLESRDQLAQQEAQLQRNKNNS